MYKKYRPGFTSLQTGLKQKTTKTTAITLKNKLLIPTHGVVNCSLTRNFPTSLRVLKFNYQAESWCRSSIIVF